MTSQEPLSAGVPLEDLAALVEVLQEVTNALTGAYKIEAGQLALTDTEVGWSIDASWVHNEWQVSIRPKGQRP